MKKASIDVKTRAGTYKMYRIEFSDERHYENWRNKIEQWGHKIIGVRFDDGYPGIDGFKNKNN